MGWKEADLELPEFKEGSKCKLISLKLQEKETIPPGYLTEATLISYMEENGIGTDASIPQHIKNIIERGYVTVGPKRTLIPTELGLAYA